MLELANDKFQLGFSLAHDVIGGAAIDKHGVPLADETLEACAPGRRRAARARSAGRSGTRSSRDIRPERGLLKIRSQLGLFANLRPGHSLPATGRCLRRSSQKSSPAWIS